MAILSDQIAKLTPERRKLLEKLLQKERVDLKRSVILPQPRDRDAFPLSFAQQRLWFLDQLEPNSPLYNIPLAVQLQGQLDRGAFQKSLDEIVRRHETLRTVLRTRDSTLGEPVQVILPEFEIPVEVVDLQGMSPDEQQSQVERRIAQEGQRPFDLRTGPLLRVTLLHLDPARHVMLLTMHHIVSDGWSMNVFVKELVTLYEAFCKGLDSPLPKLPIQYVDYAQWQRQWLQGEILQEQLTYWKKQLDPNLDVLALPTDRPRPAMQTIRGASYDLTLPKDLSARLESFGQQQGVTLFMTLLAAFQTLLYRYTGQIQIRVGTPVANRNRSEIEPLIGFFVNTLVLGADFADDPSFRELLARVRETTLGAFAHQDLPFERLVEELDPVRDMSHTPLFQVMFALQNTPLEQKTPSGLTVQPLVAPSGVAMFDLTLAASQDAGGIRLSVEYNADLWDATTIIRMMDHFIVLLYSILAHPDRHVSWLPLLSPDEYHQLVQEWNDTGVDYGADDVVQLFAARAAAAPEATAVVFGDTCLTYDQLDRRANQLARYLCRLGAGPETVVGLAVERSLDMIIGLLGILKAGAAYLPLDPDLPLERLAFMVEDAHIDVLVTQEHVRPLLPPVAHTVCLDRDRERIAAQSRRALFKPAHADSAAYVIYTSGSTGRPKGVVISRRAMTNHNRAAIDQFLLQPADHVLQFSTINFDAAVEEILPCLIAGATLVLRTDKMLMTGHQLLHLIQEHGLTILDLPTAYWHEWVYELSLLRESLPVSLRLVVVGGEEASAERLATWQALPGPRVMWLNTYGPTEGTVIATSYPVVSQWDGSRRRIPIGRPISNVHAYVLGADLQPVPISVSGELYIGGAGVARCYLRRPRETAQAFLPDPFAARPGSRLYRSGDLARTLPDGNIEFLGRGDHQVKIRGFRIEPGEIEVVLAQHPGVRDNAVLAARDESGAWTLNAYVVSMPEVELSADALREFLSQRLPEYMLPQTWTWLESLPLTATGKVDRRALPGPEHPVEPQEAYVAPRTPTEEILAGIWAQILSLPAVSIYANFFQLGGHSLLATQLVSRIRHHFQVELPVRDLFDAPTIAGLAARIDVALHVQSAVQVPPIVPVPRDGELPLSYAQQRLWFLDQLEPNSPFYNLPEAVRLLGPLDVQALEQSLNEIVRRHESLRTTFATVDGKPVQRIATAQALSLPLVDLTCLPRAAREAETRRLAREEAQRPFDLARGPLLRARLLRLDELDHAVLVTMHHIVGDNWSSNVLFRELAVLYDAFVHQRPSPLPELAIQYADYAHWQRGWLQGEVQEQQLDYWVRKLQGIPPRLELPTDRPRPAMQTVKGDYHRFVLSRELTQRVRELCQEEGVTLFMGLLAGFEVLLHRYSGQTDICVGTPVANRGRREVEGLVGFFVNTLVMRGELSGGLSYRELVRQVRATALEAYAHQDLPFEMVVDAVQPERDLSHSPLFQVMFVLQSEQASELVLPGSELALLPLEVHSGTAKFDLTLIVNEQEERLHGALEYNTDLFDAVRIERMIGHWQTLLQAMIDHPDQPISTLPLLTLAEQEELSAWNQTQTPFPDDQTLHHLFEVQAAQTPDAPAVVFEGQVLTYGELNRRANQLARHLRKLGVCPEMLVGICMDRSLEMIVGMLGILKAGGAYVPLDPAYPPERLSYMMQDTGMQVLLTQSHVREGVLVDILRTWVICLDTQWDLIAREMGQNPANDVLPDHLAYIIFTSGSTGRPKGTLLQHRGACNLITHYIRHLGIYPGRRVLQFFSFSFDGSVADIFAALLSGATVCIPHKDMLLSMPDLHRLMQEQEVTHIFMPPSALNVLPADGLPALESVLSGGEACNRGIVERWASPRRFYNGYGPTETTIASSWYEMYALPEGMTNIPIGAPLANTRYYVLDQRLEPVPVSVPGELCIGGAGVARGYLNRPRLTAERFLPEPAGTEAGARLYQTGDLVRFLPDGNVEYLGRADTQVKIRGFRIELGEVEIALSKHPAVREVAVLAREDTPGLKRLVAYVVLDPATGATVGNLRDHLRELLPEYMIPSAFVLLDALPLTPNSKLDRRALPAPEVERSALESSYLAPRTPQELVLAEIWAQILGLDQVGIEDNFFELGGDSILSIQVVARANQAGLKMTPRQLFERPTIARLAAVVGTGRGVEAEQGMVVGSVPLIPIQHWFVERNLPDPNHWNQSLLLEIKEPLVRDRLEQAVMALLAHHDALRLRLERTSAAGTNWQAYNADLEGEIPLHWLDLSALDVAATRAAIETHAAAMQASLDLAHGPLLRVAYFDLGVGRPARLLIVVHHIAVDGVSWRILLEDLSSAYEQSVRASSRTRGIQLSPKTTSFRQWAQRLEAYAQSNEVGAELDYWLSTLREPCPRLPVDYPGGSNTEASAASVTVTLDAARTQALLREAPAAYRTEINDLLLTALVQAVSRWTGSRSLLVSLEGHGREDLFPGVDISRTVGWFTTMYPVRLDLGRASGPGAAITTIKEQLRHVPQRGIGYGLLRYLRMDAAAAFQDFQEPELGFNYLGQFDQALANTGFFGLAPERRGDERCPDGNRPQLIDVNGGIAGDQLYLEWSYSQNLHRRETIERLAADYMDALHVLIAHCQSPETGGVTPADFGLAKLDQKRLDKVLAKLKVK